MFRVSLTISWKRIIKEICSLLFCLDLLFDEIKQKVFAFQGNWMGIKIWALNRNILRDECFRLARFYLININYKADEKFNWYLNDSTCQFYYKVNTSVKPYEKNDRGVTYILPWQGLNTDHWICKPASSQMSNPWFLTF